MYAQHLAAKQLERLQAEQDAAVFDHADFPELHGFAEHGGPLSREQQPSREASEEPEPPAPVLTDNPAFSGERPVAGTVRTARSLSGALDQAGRQGGVPEEQADRPSTEAEQAASANSIESLFAEVSPAERLHSQNLFNRDNWALRTSQQALQAARQPVGNLVQEQQPGLEAPQPRSLSHNSGELLQQPPQMGMQSTSDGVHARSQHVGSSSRAALAVVQPRLQQNPSVQTVHTAQHGGPSTPTRRIPQRTASSPELSAMPTQEYLNLEKAKASQRKSIESQKLKFTQKSYLEAIHCNCQPGILRLAPTYLGVNRPEWS